MPRGEFAPGNGAGSRQPSDGTGETLNGPVMMVTRPFMRGPFEGPANLRIAGSSPSGLGASCLAMASILALLGAGMLDVEDQCQMSNMSSMYFCLISSVMLLFGDVERRDESWSGACCKLM